MAKLTIKQAREPNKKVTATVAIDHDTAKVIVHRLAHEHNMHHHHVAELFSSPLAGWLVGYYNNCRSSGITGFGAGLNGDHCVENTDLNSGSGNIGSDNAVSAPAPGAMGMGGGNSVSTTAKTKFINALLNYGK